jgi:hypothetical protein
VAVAGFLAPGQGGEAPGDGGAASSVSDRAKITSAAMERTMISPNVS